jgi:hypothetical protein
MRRQQDSLSSQFVSWQRCGGGLNSAHSRVGLYDCAARFSKAVHSCQQHSASIWTLFKSMCSRCAVTQTAVQMVLRWAAALS